MTVFGGALVTPRRLNRRYAGHLSMAQKLLASGVKVDSSDASGITPLMLATSLCSTGVSKRLGHADP